MPALTTVLFLLLINVTAYAAFAWDKHCARIGAWRIPERALLGIALLGGSIGAIAAQQILRHKTRKQPFRSQLYGIVFLQVGLVLAVVFVGPQGLLNAFA